MDTDPKDFLMAIGQIGIALGGFASLVSTFRKANAGWTTAEKFGIALMFQHTGALVFFALFPFLIDSFVTKNGTVWLCVWNSREQCLWIWSSSGLAFYFLIQLILQASKLLPLKELPPFPWSLIIGFFVFTMLFFVIQIVNIASWKNFTAYKWGLFWVLSSLSIQFYNFIRRFLKLDQLKEKKGAPAKQLKNKAGTP